MAVAFPLCLLWKGSNKTAVKMITQPLLGLSHKSPLSLNSWLFKAGYAIALVFETRIKMSFLQCSFTDDRKH